MTPKPDPLSVRKLTNKNWEVLLVPEDHWLSCDSEADARLIALARVYEHEYIYNLRTDPGFPDDMEQLAGLFDKYHIGFGAQLLRDIAKQFRTTNR